MKATVKTRKYPLANEDIFIKTLLFHSFHRFIKKMYSDSSFKERISNVIRQIFFSLAYIQKHPKDFRDVDKFLPQNKLRYKFKVEILETRINTFDDLSVKIQNNFYFNNGSVIDLYELETVFRVSIMSNVTNTSFTLRNLDTALLNDNFISRMGKDRYVGIQFDCTMVKDINNLRNKSNANSNRTRSSNPQSNVKVLDNYTLASMTLLSSPKCNQLLNKMKDISLVRKVNDFNHRTAHSLYKNLLNSFFMEIDLRTESYVGSKLQSDMTSILFNEMNIGIKYGDFFQNYSGEFIDNRFR